MVILMGGYVNLSPKVYRHIDYKIFCSFPSFMCARKCIIWIALFSDRTAFPQIMRQKMKFLHETNKFSCVQVLWARKLKLSKQFLYTQQTLIFRNHINLVGIVFIPIDMKTQNTKTLPVIVVSNTGLSVCMFQLCIGFCYPNQFRHIS